jgi:hypothetical protein
VAGSQSEVADGFGTQVLIPGTGNSLASALLDVHIQDLWHIYLATGRSIWHRPTTGESALGPQSVVVGGTGILIYRDVIGSLADPGPAVLKLEVGPMARWVGGDADENARGTLLNSTRRFFFGLESGMQLSVGRLSAAGSLYWVHSGKSDGGHRPVAGLTGLQFVAGIGVSGEIVPIRR